LLGQDPPTPAQPRCDRQANIALFHIVISRLRYDQRTIDYCNDAPPKGEPSVRSRCIKRYIARDIFKLIHPVREPQNIPSAV
jgi:transposase